MASLLLKHWLFGAAEACQANALSRHLHRQSLAVLCYHGVVGEDRTSTRMLFGNTVSAGEFEAQLDYLAAHFAPISTADLIAGLSDGKRLPDNPIVVTFDDGYRNNVSHAAPILLKKGIPAIFHLTTDYIGSRAILWPDEILLRVFDWPESVLDSPVGQLHLAERTGASGGSQRLQLAREISQRCKRVPLEARSRFLSLLRSKTPSTPSLYDSEAHAFMDWEEARTLERRGFELGSHTVSHPILAGLPAPLVAVELRDSRLAVEQNTGSPCKVLAYPNGSSDDYSDMVTQEAEKGGFDLAFAVGDRWAGTSPDRWAIPRLTVPGHVPLPLFQAKVSGLYSVLGRNR